MLNSRSNKFWVAILTNLGRFKCSHKELVTSTDLIQSLQIDGNLSEIFWVANSNSIISGDLSITQLPHTSKTKDFWTRTKDLRLWTKDICTRTNDFLTSRTSEISKALKNDLFATRCFKTSFPWTTIFVSDVTDTKVWATTIEINSFRKIF